MCESAIADIIGYETITPESYKRQAQIVRERALKPSQRCTICGIAEAKVTGKCVCCHLKNYNKDYREKRKLIK